MKDSRVLNTYYTEDQDILRLRECNVCKHRQWTQQPPEQALDPDVYRVIIPKFKHLNRKRVTVRHKSEDIDYRNRQAARANDQPQPTRWNRIPKDRLQPPSS